MIRWLTILTLFLVVAMCGFYVWNTLPAARERGFFVMHYNLYLGIDDVRSWPWLFVLPLIWISLTLADIGMAFGAYRIDAHLSLSLILLAFAWSLPWSGALFYLSHINL
jgi:hypothetical protein